MLALCQPLPWPESGATSLEGVGDAVWALTAPTTTVAQGRHPATVAWTVAVTLAEGWGGPRPTSPNLMSWANDMGERTIHLMKCSAQISMQSAKEVQNSVSANLLGLKLSL